jgi:hypothetical protein
VRGEQQSVVHGPRWKRLAVPHAQEVLDDLLREHTQTLVSWERHLSSSKAESALIRSMSINMPLACSMPWPFALTSASLFG